MKAPRLIAGLLRTLAPADQVHDVLGDLEETHGRRIEQRGRLAAWLLTTIEGLDMAFALARVRLPRARLRFSWLDVRLGFRLMRRYPGLTLVAGLALSFAIAVGALTFEVVSQALNTSLPIAGGDRIVGFRLWNTEANRAEASTAADLETWRTQLRSVEYVGAFQQRQRNLITADGQSESIEAAAITAAAFDAIGASARLGRTLTAPDDVAGAPDVVVIGYRLWQERFGGAADVIGLTVRLDAVPATIVGVMPEGFVFPVAHDAWVPLRFTAADLAQRDGPPAGFVFGRLAPGATLATAQAEVATLGVRMAREQPGRYARLVPTVRPYVQALVDLPAIARMALRSTNAAAVLFLVLIAANVALLMFARTVSREAELAMRTALGASRGRIVGQLFVESLVLALFCAAAGLGLAAVGLRWVFRLAEIGSGVSRFPFWLHTGLSPSTAIYAVGLGGLVALVAGAWPAFRVTGAVTRWKAGTTGGSTVRFGGVWTGVIVTQVALTVACVPLLVDVGRDTWGLARLDFGISADEFVTARIALQRDSPRESDGADASPADRARFAVTREALLRELAADPGIRSATFGDPPGVWVPRRWIEVDGPTQLPRSPAGGHRPQVASVSTGFFAALGAPIVAGRDLPSADQREGSLAVVVNQSFVTEVLGGGSALGRRLRFRDPNAPAPADGAAVVEPWREIVGVVADLPMTADPDLRDKAGIYTLLAPADAANVIVRASGAPGAMASRLRAIAARVDPALRLTDISTLGDIVRKEQRFYAFWFRFSMAATGLLLLLSLSGIYAVVSFTVSRRTREIGIRIALGADRRRLLSEILRTPMMRVSLGAAIGAAAIALLPLASEGHIAPRVAALIVFSAVLVVIVSVLACTVPIRRALRIQPTEALRAAE